jgi:hypothetical protein
MIVWNIKKKTTISDKNIEIISEFLKKMNITINNVGEEKIEIKKEI